MLNAAAALAAVLPIALIAAVGPWRILGLVYLGMWLVIVIPSTAAYTTLILDAALIAIGKEPLYLPGIIAAHARAGLRLQSRAAMIIRRVAIISVFVNPLSNVPLAAMLLAFRLRPTAIKAVMAQATRLANAAVPAPEAVAEMSRPVIDAVERELELQPC